MIGIVALILVVAGCVGSGLGIGYQRDGMMIAGLIALVSGLGLAIHLASTT